MWMDEPSLSRGVAGLMTYEPLSNLSMRDRLSLRDAVVDAGREDQLPVKFRKMIEAAIAKQEQDRLVRGMTGVA